MSLNSQSSATLRLPEPADVIEQALRDAPRLPDWNPAFRSVTPHGTGYRVVALAGLLRGTLRYVEGPDDVTMLIDLPGLSERSTWTLEPSDGSVRVTHTVEQRGQLVPLIGASEAATVPGKRLARLATHLARAEAARQR